MALNGVQRRRLSEALLNAFPDRSSLEQLLAFELDKNLNIIAGEGNLQNIVFKLIQTAEAQGWLAELVHAAHESNPRNLTLKAIAEELLKILPGSPPVPPPPAQPIQPQKILILAAIPRGLRLDTEIREIEEAIRRAANRDLFEIRIKTAVRPQDIRRAIGDEEPQIVHFCGHGMQDGSLLLEDDGGNHKPVEPEGLAALFELYKDYVKCVLLNACYSEKSAVVISQYINYTIGMNQPIKNKAAIAFARGFYDSLGRRNSGNQDVFQRAFDEGMVAIKLENLSLGSVPVLKKKQHTLNNNKHNFLIQNQNILLQNWDKLEPDLQDAFSLAFNCALREGNNVIKTKNFFAALVRLMPKPLPEFIKRIPENALPTLIDEQVTTEKLILSENPELSACVQDSLRHLTQKASPQKKLSSADVFVDLAKHGTGNSVARLRGSGVTPEKVDEIVEQLGWEVIER